MTDNEKIISDFYSRYYRPELNEYVNGFSGIDPALRVKASELNHELLDNLLGGDETGHYHLTRKQIEKLFSIEIKTYPPEIVANQVINIVASEPMTPYEIQGENLR